MWMATRLTLALAASMTFAAAAQANCSATKIAIGHQRLFVDLGGNGPVTLVFEAGNGDDSRVWANLVPKAQALGVRTFVYDRAGLGQSDRRQGAYSIDKDVRALRGALDRCAVQGPAILVAHSYGGFIAHLLAAQDRRVAGMVLVDANIPAFFDPAETEAIVGRYRPQYAALRAQAPALAELLIPIIEAYPKTARRARAVALPPALPVIDIVAERSWAETPDEAARMRAAHAAFVAANPRRSAMLADGSSHAVMKDRPDVVLAAITQMVAQVRGEKTGR